MPPRWLIAVTTVAGSLVLLTAVSGLFVFEYWRRGTPEYSVKQIGRAIENHDLSLFRRHVDTRSIANRMLDDVAAEAVRDDSSSNALGRGLLELVRPRLLESFEAQVERFVETGEFSDQKTAVELGLDNVRNRIGTIEGIVSVQIEGKSAVVRLRITPKDMNRAVILPLKMRQTADGYWQLTEISLTDISRATTAI